MPAQPTAMRRPLGAAEAAVTAASTESASVTFVSWKVGALAELAGERLALLPVQVGDHDVSARAVQAPDRGLAEAGGPAAYKCAG